MTMVSGKGPGGAPSLDNIDLTHAKDIVCDNCGIQTNNDVKKIISISFTKWSGGNSSSYGFCL